MIVQSQSNKREKWNHHRKQICRPDKQNKTELLNMSIDNFGLLKVTKMPTTSTGEKKASSTMNVPEKIDFHLQKTEITSGSITV